MRKIDFKIWRERLSRWRRLFFTKHRFVMHNEEGDGEEWHIHLSPAGLTAGLTAVLLIFFITLLLLVAYTPVLEFLPGYRTEATRQRDMLMNSIIRLDSLEREMEYMAAYNENLLLVVNGKTPTMRSAAPTDSLKFDKTLLPPSREDSLLRRQIESLSALSNKTSTASKAAQASAVAPMYGVVAGKFNIKDGLYGVRIAGASESQVVAIEEGVVMSSDWLPDSGTTVQIQHEDGIVSVYRNMSQSLVQRGQKVRGGEVIGYSAKEAKHKNTLLELELWKGGKPIDPESYIVF